MREQMTEIGQAGCLYKGEVETLREAGYDWNGKVTFRVYLQPDSKFGLWLLPDGQLLELRGHELRTLPSVDTRAWVPIVEAAIKNYLSGNTDAYLAPVSKI